MDKPSLLSDLLAALSVPHTQSYADKVFYGMTFKSLFGLSKALEEYGVDSRALALGDKKADLAQLPVPFLAAMSDGFAIVYSTAGGTVDLSFCTGRQSMTTDAFLNKWTGTVLLVAPRDNACEPDYGTHVFAEDANVAKKWVLAAAAAFIFTALFLTNGIYRHVSLILLTLIDMLGLFVTYHLILKSLNIHSDTGDSICGLIDRTGCHTVLSTNASSFFGIFSWSEVGVAYFSVSLLALLLFPEYTGYLALINALCCPFSFWSVWYQKYRAKAWCTMCLITQACLWLSLACYICGGWFAEALPLQAPFFVLAAFYVLVLLLINAITPAMKRNENKN